MVLKAALHCWILSTLVAFSAAGQSISQSASSAPSVLSVPSAGPEAHVLILALDSLGQPVPTPAKDALRVQIGGEPVEIEEIRSLREEPLIFSMIVDESASTSLSAKRQTMAAIKLYRALSSGSNHGYLVLFNDNADASDHFLDAPAAEEKLMKAKPRGSTALYDAIAVACTKQLRSAAVPPGSRRAIFVFSDGGDNTSRQSLSQTVEAMQKEGIPVFSIKIRVDTERPRDQKWELAVLRYLSEGTGGLVIVPDEHSDLVGLLPSLLEGQSLLTFKTAALKPKKSYELRIEANEKDVHILAQRKYIAP